jgi:hypothetical protein
MSTPNRNTPRKNNLLFMKLGPPDELIQTALNEIVRRELEDFAANLEIARSVWRRFREMVEAPEFPEQLRVAYVEGRDEEPDDECGLGGEDALEPGYRESRLPDAVATAAFWTKNGIRPRIRLSREQQAQYDAKFLNDFGISD